MIEIQPLEEAHIPAVLELARSRAWQLREQVPILPAATFPSPEAFWELTKNTPARVALEGNQLVGYLTGRTIPQWNGVPAIYSPEWAHGGAGLSHLYAALAGQWQSAGYVNHTFTTMAHDPGLIREMQWLGFGGIVVDAIRDLSDVGCTNPHVEVRIADESDVPVLQTLSMGLVDHLAASPILLRYPYITSERWVGILQEPGMKLFIATLDGEDVGYLKLGSCADDVCTVVRAEDTASISGAFCLPSFRGQGVMRSLLEVATEYARETGKYQRIGVDWESNNVMATEFWTRHFTPVAFSVRRIVPSAKP